MKDINLLSGLLHSQKQFDISKSSKAAAILTVLLAIILGCAYCGLLYLNSMYTEKIHKIESEMLLYNEVTKLKKEISSETRLVEAARQLLDATSEASNVATSFFDQVSSAMGDSIFLTSLAVNENGIVSFSGKAVTRPDITHFTYTLKKTGQLSDVYISIISQDTQIPGGYSFSVSAAIRGTEYFGQ